MANVGDRLIRLVLSLFTGFAVLVSGVPKVFAGAAAWAQLTGRPRLESLAQCTVVRHYRVHRPAEPAPHPGSRRRGGHPAVAFVHVSGLGPPGSRAERSLVARLLQRERVQQSRLPSRGIVPLTDWR